MYTKSNNTLEEKQHFSAKDYSILNKEMLDWHDRLSEGYDLMLSRKGPRVNENIEEDSDCRYIIIRTAWLYSEYGKNFVKTMLQLTATKPQLKVVIDQCGTPTYALDLAQAIVTALQRPQQGIYHYSNEGVCSWYDFTQMIAAYSGHTTCDIQPCHSDEFPCPVKRPSYSVLDKTKIKETFGIRIPYWTESLKQCIHNLQKHVD